MWILPPYIHLMSTDVIHVIVLRPSLFFAAFPVLCIILNANQRTTTEDAWELGYHYTNTTFSRTGQVSHLLAIITPLTLLYSLAVIALCLTSTSFHPTSLPPPLFTNKMRKDVWLPLSWPSDRKDHWTKLSCSASSLAP